MRGKRLKGGDYLSFTENIIQKVWDKGKVIPEHDENIYRKDDYNSLMLRHAYRNRTSGYGWEIDMIDPNGGDSIKNLRPLQWKNLVNKKMLK